MLKIKKKKCFYISGLLIILALCAVAGWRYCRQNYLSVSAPNDSVSKIPILMYHKVNPNPKSGGLGLRVPPKDFDWEMHYLYKNGYHTVNLGNVVDHFQKNTALPLKPIVITFDDGYQDNYLYALPILKKYRFTATIFVVTNTIGKYNEFDLKTHSQPPNKMLNWNQIRVLETDGITIGCHTLDHVHLTRISPNDARKQIFDSKMVLEKGLGTKVAYFCYPYGDVNSTVAKMVQASGYKAATTTRLGMVTSRSNPYLLNRVRITGHYNHRRFIEELHKYSLSSSTYKI